MVDINKFFDGIDTARIRRARELWEIKRICGSLGISDPEGINSKATIVLCYAAWEGFYNDCVEVYFQFLRERGGRVRDTDWMLLIAAFSRDFDSLRDKHHSANARREFIKTYKHGSTVDLTRLTKGGLDHNQIWISPAYPITTIF